MTRSSQLSRREEPEMTKWIIVALMIAASVSMARAETVAEDQVLDISDLTVDREYECRDRYDDDQEPYVLITTYFLPEELIAEEDAPEGVSAVRAAAVTISEAEFFGLAYQSGLDYRIEFTESYNDLGDDPETTYALIIQASEYSI